MAEKMRRYSPYNYVFNNPIRLIDPDGLAPYWIKGTDGKKVTYTIKDGKVNWSSNASADTKKIGGALVATGNAGSLAKVRDAAHPITFIDDPGSNPTKYGSTDLKYNWYSSTKKGVVTGAIITVYEGSIQNTMNSIKAGGKFHNPSEQTILMTDATNNNDLNALIAATAAHEIDHATNPLNTKIAMRNTELNEKNDPETTPEAAETQALINAKNMRELFATIKTLLN